MASPLSLVPPTIEERERLVAAAETSPNRTTVEKVLDDSTYQVTAVDAVDYVMQLEENVLRGLDINTHTLGEKRISWTSWSVGHVPTNTTGGGGDAYNFEQVCGISHRDIITLTHEDGRHIPLKVFFRHNGSVALILKVEYPKCDYVPLTREDADILTAFRDDMHTLSRAPLAA